MKRRDMKRRVLDKLNVAAVVLFLVAASSLDYSSDIRVPVVLLAVSMIWLGVFGKRGSKGRCFIR